ncbi:MAG: sigma-54 dependent transcriptional regulator, partial [Myxococcota bacterium]
VSDDTGVTVSRKDPAGEESQVETLEFQSYSGLEGVTRWPCLTVLYHPDLTRVGERAEIGQLLAHQPIEISRSQPRFSQPVFGGRERGLRDPYVSRERPVRLNRVDSESIEIAPAPGVHLRVGDQPITGRITLPLSVLSAGVLLELSRRILLLLHSVDLSERPPTWNLVGDSEGIVKVREKIGQVADLKVPVLIRGETGVGKERVANAIHLASQRADQPWIAVNMATISASTAASELFGHVRGAFTGATQDHIGLFERANEGTLFLDEIGETPGDVQAMLLRTLAEGTIMAVGHHSTRPVDVRIIAATDAKIEDGGEDGSFREALYHRLSGFEIRIPPLRERRDDIGRLAVHFLRQELNAIGELWRLEPEPTLRHLWFPPALMSRLYHHSWPGNIRQLGNVIRQLVISSRGSKELCIDDSVERVLGEKPPAGRPRVGTVPGSKGKGSSKGKGKPTNREVYIAMEACNWNVGPAARMLGVPRSTLYSLIERHPDIRKAKDLSRAELVTWVKRCNGDLDQLVEHFKVSRRGIKLRLNELDIPWEPL